MASQGKRMVNENLIKYLKEMDKEGISIADLADMLSNYDASSDVFDGDTLMENVIDQDGNNRFVEGDFTPTAIEGVTYTYSKWSLSGTHLMIVLAGNCEASTSIAIGNVANVNIPSWVLNKIYPIVDSYIEGKSVVFRKKGEWWTTQSVGMSINRYFNSLTLRFEGSATITAASGFRVQFDLLIDNE